MKNCIMRYTKKEDYADVEKIMRQVQSLHVEWRPDIYKKCDTVLPTERHIWVFVLKVAVA